MKWQLGSAIALVLGTCATAASALPAEYTFYQPRVFLERTLQTLPEWGGFVLPGDLDASVSAGLPLHRANIATAEAIVGQLDQEDDTLHGRSSFTVYDVTGATLFRVRETIAPCADAAPPSRCNRIDIDTALDTVAGKPAPFSVLFIGGDLQHLRYGVETNVSAWRYELDDAYDWLHHTLIEASSRVLFANLSWHDQIIVSLASDSGIAPCAAGLTVRALGGRIIVSGIVPSSATYNLIANRLIELGVPAFDLDLTIMTPWDPTRLVWGAAPP